MDCPNFDELNWIRIVDRRVRRSFNVKEVTNDEFLSIIMIDLTSTNGKKFK